MPTASNLDTQLRVIRGRIAQLRDMPSGPAIDEELASLHGQVAAINRDILTLPEYRGGGL